MSATVQKCSNIEIVHLPKTLSGKPELYHLLNEGRVAIQVGQKRLLSEVMDDLIKVFK